MLLFCCKKLFRIIFFEWLRSKKAAIINNDNSFQNALNDALNYQNIEKDSQRILNIKPYVTKYNWKEI